MVAGQIFRVAEDQVPAAVFVGPDHPDGPGGLVAELAALVGEFAVALVDQLLADLELVARRLGALLAGGGERRGAQH